MNRKVLGIAVVLLAVAMLATPLFGTAEACCCRRICKKICRQPEIATVEYTIQVWPDMYKLADAEVITGDNIAMGFKNLATVGNPPLVDPLPPTFSNYITYPPFAMIAEGGLKLTITVDGQDYELFASFQKKELYFVAYLDGRNIEISKWSFTVVDLGDAETLDAVGDTMEGCLIMLNSKVVVTSTAGTGIFNGARLIGDLTYTPIYVAIPEPLATMLGMHQIIFSNGVGSGRIVFPRGFP